MNKLPEDQKICHKRMFSEWGVKISLVILWEEKGAETRTSFATFSETWKSIWESSLTFRETTETRPSLVIDAGGSVKVVGGIAYDPNKPPEAEKQPRSASELPPGLLSN